MTHLVETMAYTNEVPWHGLGVQVSDTLTPMEMLKAAQLDWTVSKRTMFYQDNDGIYQDVGSYALVRDTDAMVLTTSIGDGWTPCQNEEAFKIFEPFVENHSLKMETAGSLKDGQIVWGLAKVEESFDVFKGDVVDQYILLVNPHKFGNRIQLRSTPIRVVCNNTLTFALKGSDVKLEAFQHHRNVFDPTIFVDVLTQARFQLNQYKEAAEFLGAKRYTTASVQKYFADVFPSNIKDVSRNAETAFELLETQPGHEFAEGSWWQAFNSVTYMTDHLLGRNPESRLHSTWFGINKDRKNVALKKAIEYAEAA